MKSFDAEHQTGFSIPAPPDFDFWRTVYSHGWCTLPPFHLCKDQQALALILHLREGQVVHCIIRGTRGRIRIMVQSHHPITTGDRAEIRARVRACFRLDEDFAGFHAQVKRHAAYRWIIRSGSGRLLRSPTVFEDVVKMLCTTNCTWALTQVMVGNIVQKLGQRFSDGLHAFPTPAALGGISEGFMRKEIRAGYRSPYLIEFAQRVASGEIDVESWRDSPLSTPELFTTVRQIKGIGPYAAGNLLRLLGRYDYLALDSWVRAQFARMHYHGKSVSDRTIERKYKKFGPWRGLFFWFEMTKHWLKDEFPF